MPMSRDISLLADDIHTKSCHTSNMLRPHSVFPAWISLGVLFLAIWVLLTQFPREGVRVVNHSGVILRNVKVCLSDGQCATHQGIWPRDAWRVPLKVNSDENVHVTVTPDGQDSHNAQAKVKNSVQFIVHKNGTVHIH